MKILYVLTSLILLLLLINPIANAQTAHKWINGSGNWSDTTHWDTGIIPSPTDTVYIPYDPNNTTYTVTLDTNATLAKISIGGETGAQTLFMSNKTFTINGNGTVNEKGIVLLDGSTINSNGVLVNKGELSFTGNCLIYSFSAANTNSGTIVLNNSDLTLEQEGFDPSFTSTGILTIDIASTLKIKGGTFNYLSGTFALNGNLSLIDYATAHFTPSFSNYSMINLNNSTLTSDSTFTNQNILRLTNSTFNGTGSLLNEDTMFVEGICNINNTLNISPGSTIQLCSQNSLASYLKVAGGFTNHGKIEFIGSSDYFRGTLEVANNTPLINGLDGIIRVSSTGNTMFKDRILARLNNQGTITLNNSLEIKKQSVDHINSGTIKVIEGELTLEQTINGSSFLNTGELIVNVNNTLKVNGGSFTHNSGIFRLYGTLSTSSNADLDILPPFTNEGTIFLNSSTLNLGGSLINLGEMTLTDSKLTGNDTLSNYWNIKIINSSVDLSLNNDGFAYFTGRDSINSNIINRENSTIQLSSIYNTNCYLTVANDFENFGTLEFEVLYFNVSGTLDITNGDLINMPQGKIISKSNPQYANRIFAELDNQGLITIEDSLVISRALAHHTNSNKIELNFGGVIEIIGESFINNESGNLTGRGTIGVTDVSFTNYGRISPRGTEPNFTAILDINGELPLENSSEIHIKLGRTPAGKVHDQLNVSDSTFLDGELHISFINSPSAGDTFEVMTFSGYTANFDSITFDEPNGVTLVPEFTPNSLILICIHSVNLPPEAIDDTVAVPMDSTTIIDVLANDSDPNGDSLSIVEIIGPANGTALIMSGDTLVSYTPPTGFTGSDSFQYVITDGEFSDTAEVFITVTLMNIAQLNNLNLPIMDFQVTSSTIPITISAEQLFGLVGVEVLIDSVFHFATGDLEFTLSHNGIVDTLIYRVGSTGDHFINTKLSDAAITPISEGTPPFTGFYKPHQSLKAFAGSDPNGEWTLNIYDGMAGNSGILISWGLTLFYQSVTGIEQKDLHIPISYQLEQNYPNPFNPTTTIEFSLPHTEFVTLKIYNILGEEVATLVSERLTAGGYKYNWDASSLASGVYLYRIQAGNYVEAKKMVLLR